MFSYFQDEMLAYTVRIQIPGALRESEWRPVFEECREVVLKLGGSLVFEVRANGGRERFADVAVPRRKEGEGRRKYRKIWGYESC